MKSSFFISILFFLSISPLYPQETFRVIWYNVENLFDTQKHPENDDGEFTPSGHRRWNLKRYRHKLHQIARVLTAAGEWEVPALIGLCEIENEKVIRDLLTNTPLSRQKYSYCLGQSRDNRGIRTVLLFQKERYKLIGHTHISVSAPSKGYRDTRDILHAWGTVATGDTLDVLLTHFPSRYGGELESKKRRVYAANVLKKACDSLVSLRHQPYILLMGDFNDTPRDPGLTDHLKAIALHHPHHTTRKKENLYNLLPKPDHTEVKGTHKYQGVWAQLDHILINGSLLDTAGTIHLHNNPVRIFSPSFLLTEDKTWRGMRPWRSFHGYTYEAGYSDHLPLIADFLLYLPDIAEIK